MFELCLEDAVDVQALWWTDFPIIHHHILDGSRKVPCKPGPISIVEVCF